MKTGVKLHMVADLAASLRIALVTIVVCGGLYPLALAIAARFVAPGAASGSLIFDARGKAVGSTLIAQEFRTAGYFWPRPSAVAWNAASAGGSNLSPAGPEIRDRAKKTLAAFGADSQHPLPADLVTASGSGLDPYISLAAARYQAPRIAASRGISLAEVQRAVAGNARCYRPFWTGPGLVNVLVLNRELDAATQRRNGHRP